MMSVKKMLIGGAAVFVTVSLIGCKDDDDDDCSGVTGSFTFDPSQPTAGFDLSSVTDSDCSTCLSGEIEDTPATERGIGTWVDAFNECGGSFTFDGGDACQGDTVSNDDTLNAVSTNCKTCMGLYNVALFTPLATNTATADATSKAAFEACDGESSSWTA